MFCQEICPCACDGICWPRGRSFHLIYFSLSSLRQRSSHFGDQRGGGIEGVLCDCAAHVSDSQSRRRPVEMRALPPSLKGSDLRAPSWFFLHIHEPARPRLLFSDTAGVLLLPHCCISACKAKKRCGTKSFESQRVSVMSIGSHMPIEIEGVKFENWDFSRHHFFLYVFIFWLVYPAFNMGRASFGGSSRAAIWSGFINNDVNGR